MKVLSPSMYRVAALVCSSLALSACQSEGTPGNPSPPTNPGTTAPPSDGVLSSYFVESFAAFESAAQNLRDSVYTYTRQNTSLNWPVDNDGDGVADDTLSTTTYPFASSRIEYAHAAGLTGKGSTIGVIDTGFLTSHDAFSGKTITVAAYANATKVPYGTNSDTHSHGTGVASIAAGNAVDMIGVAPEANLVLGSFDTDQSMAAATRAAISSQAVALNNSWGYLDAPANQAEFDWFKGTNPDFYDALQDYVFGDGDWSGGVVVVALDNDENSPSADILAGLPAVDPSLEGGWLAVGNADADWDTAGINGSSKITGATRLSSECHEAAQWCLVAEGIWDFATIPYDAEVGSTATNGYAYGIGTSFAAPMVSGALALLQEAFPDLTPHDLRLRLLASADNSWFAHEGTLEIADGFEHGYNSEFGHGFLDLRAALLPIGDPKTTLSDGSKLEVKSATMVSGGASGDRFAEALRGVEAVVTDALSADFAVDARTLVATSPTSIGRRHKTLTRSNDLTATGVMNEMSGVRIDVDNPDFELAVLATEAGTDTPAATFGKQFRFDGGSAYIGGSIARDAGQLFPRAVDGALTTATGIQLGFTADIADGTNFFASAEVGRAEIAKGGGFRTHGVRYSSSRLGVSTRKVFSNDDMLSVSLARPVAITEGQAEFMFPIARSNGSLDYDPMNISLVPDEREIDLVIQYRKPLGRNVALTVDLTGAQNFGHSAGVGLGSASIGIEMRF